MHVSIQYDDDDCNLQIVMVMVSYMSKVGCPAPINDGPLFYPTYQFLSWEPNPKFPEQKILIFFFKKKGWEFHTQSKIIFQLIQLKNLRFFNRWRGGSCRIQNFLSRKTWGHSSKIFLLRILEFFLIKVILEGSPHLGFWVPIIYNEEHIQAFRKSDIFQSFLCL